MKNKKVNRFLLLCLTFLLSIIATPALADLSSDPFVRQNTAREQFEPGGKYHLFGSRGSVTERHGDIHIIPVAGQQIGHLKMEYGIIDGKIGYTVSFSGHGHEVHSPFDNHASRSASDSDGTIGVDLTSYSMQWTGHEHHPADGYDGPQGGGYPAPTGARDEYTYVIRGEAGSLGIDTTDMSWHSFSERVGDRFGNAAGMASDGIGHIKTTATTSNPELNRWGRTAEIVNASVSGVGNVVGSVWEIAGMGDITEAASTLSAVAKLESVRVLPHAAQISAVKGMTSVADYYDHVRDDLGDSYRQWEQSNPNAAQVAGVAGTISKPSLPLIERREAGGEIIPKIPIKQQKQTIILHLKQAIQKSSLYQQPIPLEFQSAFYQQIELEAG